MAPRPRSSPAQHSTVALTAASVALILNLRATQPSRRSDAPQPVTNETRIGTQIDLAATPVEGDPLSKVAMLVTVQQ